MFDTMPSDGLRTVFTNANVLTLDPNMPSADTVVVEGHRIVWVGMRSDASLEIRAIDRELFQKRSARNPLFGGALLCLVLFGAFLLDALPIPRSVGIALVPVGMLLGVLFMVEGFGRPGHDLLGSTQSPGSMMFFTILFDAIALGALALLVLAFVHG